MEEPAWSVHPATKESRCRGCGGSSKGEGRRTARSPLEFLGRPPPRRYLSCRRETARHSRKTAYPPHDPPSEQITVFIVVDLHAVIKVEGDLHVGAAAELFVEGQSLGLLFLEVFAVSRARDFDHSRGPRALLAQPPRLDPWRSRPPLNCSHTPPGAFGRGLAGGPGGQARHGRLHIRPTAGAVRSRARSGTVP